MGTFIGTDIDELITPGALSATVIAMPPLGFPSAEADLIDGGGGNDTIDGGAGNDIVTGGTGNDQVLLGAGDDLFRAQFDDGFDTVHGGSGVDRLEYLLRPDVSSTFSLDASGIRFIEGNVATNVAILNAFEVLALTFSITTPLLEIRNVSELALQRIELDATAATNPSLSFDDSGNSTNLLIGLEHAGDQTLITGMSPEIAIRTSPGAITALSLRTGLGNDVIDASRLAATTSLFVSCGAGDDVFIAGAGAEGVIGESGVDTVSYGRSSAAVTINLAQFLSLGGFAEGDSVNGFENVTGTAFADSLTGDFQANGLTGGDGNDLLDGGDGDDFLVGGAGADSLNGRAGIDRMIGGDGGDFYIVNIAGDSVEEAEGDSGVDTVLSSVSFTLGTGVENLRLRGAASLQGTGNGLANHIEGSDAANVLLGAGANDILRGLSGNDRMSGGFGDDRLSGGFGFDQLIGGAGRDAFQFDMPFLLPDVDRLTDFAPVDDTIFLRGTIFNLPAGLLAADAFVNGTTAQDADDRVLYDRATGRLFIDVDGVGGDAAILFALVRPDTELTNLDFRGI